MSTVVYTKAKAVTAAIGVVVVALTAGLADDALNLEETGHIIASIIACGVAVYGVFRVPNHKVAGGHTVSPQAHGDTTER